MRLLLPPLFEDDIVPVDLVARPKVVTVILMRVASDTTKLRNGMGDSPCPRKLSGRRRGPKEVDFHVLAASGARPLGLRPPFAFHPQARFP